MVNPITADVPSNFVASKLQDSLISLSQKLKTKEYAAISVSINETLSTLNTYFSNIENIEFIPEFLRKNDTPRSELYNKNLFAIYNDLKRLYEDIKNLNEMNITSYNYSQIISQEIIEKANDLAGLVIDLNILNNLDRGDIIVAGDDFKNYDYIDNSVGLSNPPADLFVAGNGLTLKRIATQNVTNEKTKVEIIPLSPLEDGEDEVRTQPSLENLNRFYEGNYYNFLGLARPEGGGEFRFQYIAYTGVPPITTGDSQGIASFDSNRNISFDLDSTVINENGAYIPIKTTENEKKSVRSRMFDDNPATFWECEYVYRSPNLLDDINLDVGEEEDLALTEVVLDLETAEATAKLFDDPGRDLILDIIITFDDPTIINTVNIDPVIFGANAFPEIINISAVHDGESDFRPIEGWNSFQLARVLTPEANEYLSSSETSALLAPSRSSYVGQGIFVFPSTTVTKVKLNIKVEDPVPSLYERIYVLLKNDLTVTTTVTTTTKKGLLR